jgi:hypothetical protein
MEAKYKFEIFAVNKKTRQIDLTVTMSTKKVTAKRAGELLKEEIKKAKAWWKEKGDKHDLAFQVKVGGVDIGVESLR